MTNRQFWLAAMAMKNGNYGSFAEHIGKAYIEADEQNAQTLALAFKGLFENVYNNLIHQLA
jgi:hypothetical protein